MKKSLNKNMKFKTLTLILALCLIVSGIVCKSNVHASSYVYDYWKNIIPSSEGITYKETYYNTDIFNENNPSEHLEDFNSLNDMEVFGNEIFLLDQSNEEVPLGTGSVQIENMGKLIVINQDFQFKQVVNEFPITDQVKKKLDDYYHFDTPLKDITAEQVKSTEFVDIYDAAHENAVVDNKVAVFKTFEYHHDNPNAVLKLYKDGKLINPDTYTTETKEVKETIIVNQKEQVVTKVYTFVTFNNLANGITVEANYRCLETPGRAPYLPYSKDQSKAALRLLSPQGVTVTEDAIYIADTENLRILKLNHDFEVIDVYLTPKDSSFYQIYGSAYDTEYGVAYETIKITTDYYNVINSNKLFKPTKVAVNSSNVAYCIVKDVYEGLVEFGANTEFNRYVGKNVVAADALKKLWSKIWSEKQYESQALDLPSMFNNITISPDGFLYATSNPDADSAVATNLVQVINNKGNDIMNRNGYVTPDGDAVYIKTTNDKGVVIGPSVLTAVAVSKTGNFTVTDEKRGRLFTYDNEGNLLYITGEQPGGTGSSASGGLSNSIVKPIAVDYFYRTNQLGEEEETVIVLDQSSKSIILFETTEFGRAVNTATYLYQNGVITDTFKVDEDGEFILDENGNKIVISEGAESYWRRVIKMNTNYELAYLGIGKALNRRGQYEEAMKYFKLAHNATYYSKAYSSYRDQVLNKNFNLMMTVILFVVAGYAVSKVTKYINKKNLETVTKEGGKE